MQRKLGTILTIVVIVAIAFYMNKEQLTGAHSVEPAPAATSSSEKSEHAWPTPSAADIERLKAEPKLRASATEYKKLKAATVVRVVDGDTVELTMDGKTEKVRLLNVNTPETVDPRKPVEEYGKEASAFTKSILKPGTKVRVRPEVEERDRYGRLLLHVYLEDRTWFNALLVRAGYGQVMTISPNVAAADFFKELQAKARSEEIGLWQVPDYKTPTKK